MISPLKQVSFVAAIARVHMFRMAMGKWWRQAVRPRLRKTSTWLQSKRSDIFLIVGWALVTWSAFDWNKKAWAASIGAYFFTNVAAELLGVYYTSKKEERAALRRDK